jgi:hypothetical protein
MAKVRKKNRILTVNDNEVESFLKQGYDQIDEKTGEIIRRATAGKVVPVAEFNKVLEENAALKAEIDELKKFIDAKKEQKKAPSK